MTEKDLFTAIAKYGLTLTPTGTLNGGWVAYNNDRTGRGPTPEDAVRDVVNRLEGYAPKARTTSADKGTL